MVLESRTISDPDVRPPAAIEEIDEEPPRTAVPPAFYSDEEPPEPPEDDPHWREFPLFESMKATHLLIAAIILGVLFATFAHLMLLLTVQPGT